MKASGGVMLSLRQGRGFTLIELMIVVAVVAILASIAYPAYQDSVRKSRRGEAKADIMELTQGYERFFTVNNTYVGFDAVKPYSQSPRQGVARYNITANETATTFTVTATPTVEGGQNRDACGILSINNRGVKTSADNATCW